MLRPKTPPAVVLFDIDGTLIRRAGPHHRTALISAIRRSTGLETTTEGIPLHGMLDPDILAAMMRNAGASTLLIRRSMARICANAQSLYVRNVPDLQRKVCPGVRRLLARLDRLHVPLGLVTGNLSRIGWKKVERAGLRSYFRLAAFAGMSRDRAGLVRLAVREARERGWAVNSVPVWLIGDTPIDVRAAQLNGVRSVAVATGLSTREELEASTPDVLVDDLRELRAEQLIGQRSD
jgi:phosphoglycolate phosphatase-like HAD superfamily hydrolase